MQIEKQYDMIVEVWYSHSEIEVTACEPHQSKIFRENGVMPDDSIMIDVIHADSWEDAMKIYDNKMDNFEELYDEHIKLIMQNMREEK